MTPTEKTKYIWNGFVFITVSEMRYGFFTVSRFSKQIAVRHMSE